MNHQDGRDTRRQEHRVERRRAPVDSAPPALRPHGSGATAPGVAAPARPTTPVLSLSFRPPPARSARGATQPHGRAPRGRVVRLESDFGYGFISTDDARDVYFHFHSVLGGAERLEVGSLVSFSEELGNRGPQASSVRLLRTPRVEPSPLTE